MNFYDPMKPHERVVYNMLRKAAERGDECPSNAVLLTAMGFTSQRMASETVAKLEARGLIAVERTKSARRVTIVSTGEQTAPFYVGKRRQPPKVRVSPRRDELADLIAGSEAREPMTFAQAAAAMGISISAVGQLWKRICEETDLLIDRGWAGWATWEPRRQR